MPGKKKASDPHIQFLKTATEHLENTKDRDEDSVYGESWACSFRKLSPMQQMFAKQAIEEILLQDN